MLSFDRTHGCTSTYTAATHITTPDDRQLSTWLPVISKRVKFFPMVELVLTRTGPYLVKVSAKVWMHELDHAICTIMHVQVTPVPKHYLEEQPQLAQEFKNPNFWPKPLLVYYRWESHKQVNESLGLYVLLVSGLGMMVLLALSVVSTFGDKLEQFINDVGREDDVHNGAPPGAGPPAQSMAVPYPPASPSMGFAAAAASSPFFPPPMVPPPRGPKAD